MAEVAAEKKVEEEVVVKSGELLFCGATAWDAVGRRKGLEGNLVSPTRLRPLIGVNICLVASGCGSTHCVALDVNGRCYTWGRNEKGQLGHGDTIQRDRPTVVSGLSKHKIVRASSGKNHTVVVTEDGSSFAFGWNKHGQLGMGSTKNARLGTTTMAAFQVCLQVWLTSSLLSDGLAVAGQAILACAFAEKDYEKATAAARRVLQMGFVLGLSLAVAVGIGLYFGSGIFSKDKHVLLMISVGVPFVACTQPINSLAFVFDGINYGSFDFAYSAYSMVMVAAASIGCLFLLSKSYGFIGIWIALSIYMVLRAFAGFWRVCSGTGPWLYLRGNSSSKDTISEVV